MRQIAMFVMGFAVVATIGVAVAQTTLVAGTAETAPAEARSIITVATLPDVEAASTPGVKSSALRSTTKNSAQVPVSEDGAEGTPLVLNITSPADQTRVEVPEMTLQGVTTPGAYVWSGERVAEVAADGTWSLTVPLQRGKNQVHVGAKLNGVSETVHRTVYWGDELVWSITQKVKASEAPFEKFYGTGSPGMRIEASSRYGSASTLISASGEWLLGIDFTSEPGTTFPVTVTTSTGWTATYTFTHVGHEKVAAPRDWTINHKYADNHEPFTKFHGTGPAGTTIAATSQFGSADAAVDKNGEWYLKVWFEVSEATTIDVRVTNSLGFDRVYQFHYQPAEAKHHDFQVTQLYGSSHESPPFEVFSGRTAPFTWVKAWSEFGWTKVESNAEGWFELKVVFDAAPFDLPFSVEVLDGVGNSATFSFVRLSAES